MEYWQWLINLAGSRYVLVHQWVLLTTSKLRNNLETILSTWTVVMAHNATSLGSDGSATHKMETMHHHTQENYEKDLKAVQELEGHLGVSCHWVPEDEEWQTAAHLVANWKYQQALDNLERLVMSQIFKLLKALSHHPLEFDEVVEYAFLADFDLLRDTRQDILMWPWASPAAWLAINTYFKLCQAEEEVIHLNVEIRCIVMYLVDEENYLHTCEALYQDTHPALAHQISIYHAAHSWFTLIHLHTLKKMSCLPGSSGTLAPGISVTWPKG